MNLKGGIRYVTSTTALLCESSVWLAFGAVGLATTLSALLFLVFGRMPHER